MNISKIIIAMFAVQIMLLFGYIYHHNLLINLFYEQQKHESQQKNLLKEKLLAQQRLEELKNLKNIKHHAIKNVHMVPQRLSHITTLYRDQIT